ncbi:YoaK family protein [Shewanella intestini]|uniref:DUF1275 domain-containing protein n=1 Tax=Shewanella intestini TaxID=2017544 RepID=A0ABS5HZ06_9GAMM|nr:MULTISPECIES: YoaK family protein [Shewanella]MBR9727028.1 DUF1275 domain-containing protein [Shewanella intestini]MRG35829.1 DUF1275 domain-containing protein [Shewanella sp. XMDDZSB0408]
MISKLPNWVEVGAFVLALVAGFINAIGLLGFEHQSVSHLSGTASLLGASLFSHSFAHTLHLLGVVLAFLAGASFAGFLLHGTRLKLGRHYDTALFIEALLLVISFVFLSDGSFYGQFFASAACGLQNSLASTYSGAVVRTTHLTGIFTDLGIMIGSVLRGERLDKRKAKLFMLIIVGFIFGGTVGAFCYSLFQFTALLLPASICLIVALIYRLYFKYHPLQC